MTVEELIAILRTDIALGKYSKDTLVHSVGPDSGGYDAIIDADVRVLQITQAGGQQLLVIVGAGDYEQDVDHKIEEWLQ